MERQENPQASGQPTWKEVLAHELNQPYFAQLMEFVEQERASGIPIYPSRENVFNALAKTPYAKVKVVIVGQDPYHGPGQAHGLCFSVQKGVRPPPSLQNIFKELQADVGAPIPTHGCLENWADQGVLLLNATLTVRQGTPMSHHGKGWERFTDAVIAQLCQRAEPVIFLLWGRSAQEKCQNVLASTHSQKHTVLTAAHPSPYSAHQGFFGCRHFSKANRLLQENRQQPISWAVN
jgi:uracil-DNA glycosylase